MAGYNMSMSSCRLDCEHAIVSWRCRLSSHSIAVTIRTTNVVFELGFSHELCIAKVDSCRGYCLHFQMGLLSPDRFIAEVNAKWRSLDEAVRFLSRRYFLMLALIWAYANGVHRSQLDGRNAHLRSIWQQKAAGTRYRCTNYLRFELAA